MTSLKRIALLGTAGALGALAVRTILRNRSDFSYRNKVVVITGGSRGLGLVMARQLAEQGAKLAICARHADELNRAETELRRTGATVFARVCDVTRREQVEEFIDSVHSILGPVDVLINNAGIISVGPLETMTRHDFEEALATHLWGPLSTIEVVLPSMRQRREGRIINIASIGGKISVPHLIPYSVSKFALVGLSQGLRAELAKDGITVTTVCPGLMRTGSPRNASFKGQHEAEYTWFSISDSLPVATIRAERAARHILRACQRGQAELVVSLPARIAVRLSSLIPELTADTMALMNRLLPGPGGIGPQARKGSQSETALSPSWITTLNERAAVRNNEVRT